MPASPARWPDAGLAGLGQDTDVERTPFDDGMVRQEKRYTAALLESDADLVRFRTWARQHAHTWFAWQDPEDGTVRNARVRGGAGGIAYTARVTGDQRRMWELSYELEGMAADTTGA